MAPAVPALLLLADGRFPSGGHAHSGGLEAAAGLEGVNDVDSLEAFLRGRLATAGLLAATFAAAACGVLHDGMDPAAIDALEDEFDARTPSPTLRVVSRRLGRQVLRVGRIVWPDARLDTLGSDPGRGPHQPIAFGAVAGAAGLNPDATALVSAQEAAVGPATAAVRLLGLDPFVVQAALARLGSAIAAVAAAAAGHAHASPAELPACATPLLDICAEHHATWEVRLFAS